MTSFTQSASWKRTSEGASLFSADTQSIQARHLNYGLVVLGVVYPIMCPQSYHPSAGNPPALPASVALGQRKTDSVFHDPFSHLDSYKSSVVSQSIAARRPPRSERGRTRRGGRKSREEAINAVAADLRRLAEERNRHRYPVMRAQAKPDDSDTA